MSRYIPVSVNDEYIEGSGVVIGAAGSHDDVFLRMTFGDMWEGLAKYVTFRDAAGENPTLVALEPHMVVPGTTDTYDVPTPAAAKAIEGRCSVTVSGYTVVNDTQEDTATLTVRSFFRVLPSDYALFEDGSIDATLAQQIQAEIEDIKDDILDARQAAKDSEAWAVGQVEGVDVPDTADQYHNNAKYYAQQADNDASSASADALKAEGFAVGEQNGTPVSSGTYYHNNAKYYKEQADTSASNAATSESNALGYKNDAAGSASDAKDYRDAAYGYMGNAAGSAAEALASEGLARGYASDAGSAKTAAETAQGKAEDAQAAAETAQGKAEDAQTAAETAQGKAEDAQGLAETWATGGSSGTPGATNNAKWYSDKAEDWATLAESYAVGGTESRTGEDTDNAEYYADLAHLWADGGTPGDPSSVNNASYWAYVANSARKTAQSYAVGGTGSRVGENTDNSKYYSQQAAASAGSLVPTFDDSETYAAGDLVLYDSAIYRFTAAHTGAWTGTDAVQTSIAGELTVKADLDSPALTGTPTAPTPADGDNSTKIATTAFVSKAAFDAVVNSMITDTASGSIATFPDGADNVPVKDMTVKIDPVQDLHGYANPWPAGGGVNKLDVSTVTWKKWRYTNDAFTTLPDTATYPAYTVNADETITISTTTANCGIGFEITAVDYDRTFSVTGLTSGYMQMYDSYTDGATRINTGSTSCVIPANTAGFVGVRLGTANTTYTIKLQIEAGSTATAWTPYSNICPISGWTGVNIENISDYAQYFKGLLDGTYDFVDMGDLSWAMQTIATGANFYSEVLTDAKALGEGLCGSYPVTQTSTTDRNMLYIGNSQRINVTADGYSDAVTFANAMNGVYLIYELATPTTPTITPAQYATLLTAFGLQGASYATSFVDGNGDPVTVYKSSLNPLTQGQTATHALVDLSALGWTATSWGGWRTGGIGWLPTEIQDPNNYLVENYAPVLYADVQTSQGLAVGNSTYPNRIFVNTGDADTQPTGNALLPLATPSAYNIDPVLDIVTLYGDNNVWADCGDLELTYRADTGLYVAKKLGA